MLRGLRLQPDDFTPRPVFAALQNTNTLFSDTHLDPSIKIESESKSSSKFSSYAFRSSNGKAILAYWLPILSKPGGESTAQTITLKITNSGIRNPVLLDITSGRIARLGWRSGMTGTLDRLPLRDSVMAIADQSYLDWPELPEAPSDLNAGQNGTAVQLTWKIHGGHPEFVSVERRSGREGNWQPLSKLPARNTSYSDNLNSDAGKPIFYRLRAGNSNGASAYSNVATMRE
jgi:hypothetical protein